MKLIDAPLEIDADFTLRDSRLEGWIAHVGPSSLTIDLVAGREVVTSLDVPCQVSGKRFAFAVELPPHLADGRVRCFRLRERAAGRCVAELVDATPLAPPGAEVSNAYAQAPRFAVNRAPHRYVSLERQLQVASATSERDGMSLVDYMSQLDAALRQNFSGIEANDGSPTPLRFPEHARPRASVVIPVHDKFPVTYNCLAALLLAPNRTTFEVIVVDDRSSDLTTALESFVSGITIVRNEENLGFIGSCNSGADYARGDFIVMLNNDVEPCAGWLDEMIRVFENHSDVGLTGSKLVYPDGRLQEAGCIVFPDLVVRNYGRGQNAFDPAYNYTRQVDYCSGACIMLPAVIWRALGGFDELYKPAYYEDNDLAFRVREHGLKTFYTPLSEIVHFEGVSGGTSLTTGVKRYQAINEPKFQRRWAETIRAYSKASEPLIARDRAVSLRALVIDVQVPQPDRDAGSYAAVQEIKLLQALGFKATFLPCNLAYIGNYTEDLQRLGVECLYAPFVQSVEGLIEERGAEFDLFYITRYSVADRCIAAIRSAAPRAKIVFNNADLHFLREIRAALAAKDDGQMAAAVRTRDIELDVMRRVDVTLSYTDTEAAVIVSHNLGSTTVARCPWIVEVAQRVAPFADRNGLAFLGNFRHPPNAEAVRYFIGDVLPRVREAMPDLVLRIYGSGMPDTLLRLSAPGVEICGYVKDVAEVYDRCRIFVAPLRSGAGIKGKVLGALAAGVPSIMSPLAAEGIGFGPGTEAFVAETADDWVRQIAQLYNDERAWAAMSGRAQKFARDNFSFETGLRRMRAALALAGVYAGGNDSPSRPHRVDEPTAPPS